MKLEELAKVLACPKCGCNVDYDRNNAALLCFECNLSYPISDEIPVMLIDSATPIHEDTKE